MFPENAHVSQMQVPSFPFSYLLSFFASTPGQILHLTNLVLRYGSLRQDSQV